LNTGPSVHEYTLETHYLLLWLHSDLHYRYPLSAVLFYLALKIIINRPHQERGQANEVGL